MMKYILISGLLVVSFGVKAETTTIMCNGSSCVVIYGNENDQISEAQQMNRTIKKTKQPVHIAKVNNDPLMNDDDYSENISEDPAKHGASIPNQGE